jgi:outer membrane lipoprotein-sorting protein
MTNTDILKKKMIEALEKSLGIVTSACKSVEISRETHYRWLKEDPEYKAAVDALDDVALDFAESQLHKQIKDGNSTATIFYLKTKGKKRGYIERTEITGADNEPIKIEYDLSKLTADELRKLREITNKLEGDN